MKKYISLILSLVMVLSLAVPAFADYSTKVTYNAQGSSGYTVTVPASLTAGSGSGTVTASGSWASNQTLTVTASETIDLVCDLNASDKETVAVTFASISQLGSDTQDFNGNNAVTEPISVAAPQNALFGTWTGTIYYNVSLETEEVETPVVPEVTKLTVAGDGVYEGEAAVEKFIDYDGSISVTEGNPDVAFFLEIGTDLEELLYGGDCRYLGNLNITSGKTGIKIVGCTSGNYISPLMLREDGTIFVEASDYAVYVVSANYDGTNDMPMDTYLEIDNGTYKARTALYAGIGTAVNVNGGTFTGDIEAKNGGMINLRGGTFDGDLVAENGGVLTISSGTFTNNPTSFVSDGYSATENSDGTWTVS